MLRVGEQIGTVASLYHIAVFHHHDLVRQRAHDSQIMADEHIGQPPFRLQITQQINDLHLHSHVQRRRRLVQHHQFRAQDHGAGNGDALALTARKFMRVTGGHRGIKAHLCHHLCDHFRPVAARIRAMHAQTFGNDFRRCHAGRQAAERVLKHNLHLAALRPQGGT